MQRQEERIVELSECAAGVLAIEISLFLTVSILERALRESCLLELSNVVGECHLCDTNDS